MSLGGAVAGRGPASKGTRSRARDQRRLEAETTVIQADGQLVGPELSDDVLPDDRVWPEATRVWWETWRRSAQAKTFTETDWSFLLDTAVYHAQFWSGDLSVGPELRLRAAKFGATPEDRMRLKLSVGTPAPAPVKKAAAPRQQKRRSAILTLVTDAEEAGA